MRLRAPFVWPEDRRGLIRRATRLELATLFWMTTIVVAIYFVMGSSQAMKAAWIEDLLGFVPAIAFLVARRFERRPPDAAFPHGYQKASLIAHLVAATALMMLGLYILYDSGLKLVTLEHPTIGLVEVAGFEFWLGWGMIAALVYSMIPPFVLGRMKRPVARDLHDRVLLADAAMQTADWRTAGAAILGIVGVGFGLWWADAVAALAISVSVVNDGRRHIAQAVAELAEHAPEALDGDGEDPVVARLGEAVAALPWVERLELQLRSEGRLITGTVFVRPRDGLLDTTRHDEATRAAESAHWRIHQPIVTLLPEE